MENYSKRASENEPVGSVTYKKDINGVMSCNYQYTFEGKKIKGTISNIGTYTEGNISMSYK